MDKQEAVKIITSAAKQYQQSFVRRNYLYIYDTKKSLEYIETVFNKSNFLHLTGVNTSLAPSQFFDRCINRKLSLNDFDFKDDGTTQLKLVALPKLLQVNKSYKMLGIYNGSKPKLFTDKLAGGQYCCMGFVSNGKYYVPNTVLQEDIRDITQTAYRIIAIYSKAVDRNIYTDCLYIAKGISKNDTDAFVTSIK